MAAVEYVENLRVREDFFVTFDENTDNVIFWLFDTSRFFNSGIFCLPSAAYL
jgi:hypothetical protein